MVVHCWDAFMTIEQNVSRIVSELPQGIKLVVAAKGRTPQEIVAAVEGGAEIVGENYVQEAEEARKTIGNKVEWHFIGHLQKHKVKRAVEVFDVVETVDSVEIAREIDKRCGQAGRVMQVLVEINSAQEEKKFGVLPEDTEQLIREVSNLPNIRVMGLMTMGPLSGTPEDSRPYFAQTRKLFEKIKELNLPNVEMKYLSMGMTESYKIAIEEGANIVRIGTKIFGERAYHQKKETHTQDGR